MVITKLFSMAIALAAISALTDCGNSQTPVEKAQQNLNETRANAAKDVQSAESKLAEAIAKSNATADSASRALDQSTSRSTTSGATRPMSTSPATHYYSSGKPVCIWRRSLLLEVSIV